MVKNIQVSTLPHLVADNEHLKIKLAQKAGVNPKEISGFHLIKKSIDARGKDVKYIINAKVFINESFSDATHPKFSYQNVSNAKHSVIIIGAGPCGLFCALRLIELGVKPIIFERGKDVRNRRRDLAVLNKEGILNEESNYCFGEGGAGTYSDGKLYTRSSKRGSIENILGWFVQFGAPENIIWDAHPHIGTNKLPNIIVAMRNAILECGGQVHFEAKLTGLRHNKDLLQNIQINQSAITKADAYILATGHSARDVFELLKQEGIYLEAKPFALGVRVEHHQSLIDAIQYHSTIRNEFLPPASYSLVQQVDNRGIFSFCMCPGGIIAPASTAQGELVVNGWSPSKRNNPFANSGMVVQVNEQDAIRYFNNKNEYGDPLLLMNFQQEIEKKVFDKGGGKFVAPAQRMHDFIHNKSSNNLPENSYLPGTVPAMLSTVLPQFINHTLQKGFQQFGKRLKGFDTNDAIVVATESRTSSPVKIPRKEEVLHHIQIRNLYPSGEGAGYAGGIVSAAMDGIKIAEAIAKSFNL